MISSTRPAICKPPLFAVLVWVIEILSWELRADEGFDKAAFRATHNSYAGGQLRSIPEQLDAGARVLELDLYADDFDKYHDYRIGHDSPGNGVMLGQGNPTSPLAAEWLRKIKSWSDGHPNHAPLTIVLDLKAGFLGLVHDNVLKSVSDCAVAAGGLAARSSFADGDLCYLNQLFLEIFGSKLFPATAYKGSWPTVYELRGRILCVLSGDLCTRRQYRWDHGHNPAVSMNSRGQVVEVHDSGTGHLWYWTGQYESAGSITWYRHGRYDTGQKASVAINDDGWVIEVHQSPTNPRPTLFYQLGRLNAQNEIEWYHLNDGIEYDHGIDPTIRFNSGGQGSLTEIHRSEFRPQNWRWDVSIDSQSKRLVFQNNRKADEAAFPKDRCEIGDRSVVVSAKTDLISGDNSLFYSTSAISSARLQYRQIAFVEFQEGDPDDLLRDGTVICAGAYAAQGLGWAEQMRKQGKIVRLWEFNDQSSSAIQSADAPANWPATDKLFEQWYEQYCTAIHAVR